MRLPTAAQPQRPRRRAGSRTTPVAAQAALDREVEPVEVDVAVRVVERLHSKWGQSK